MTTHVERHAVNRAWLGFLSVGEKCRVGNIRIARTAEHTFTVSSRGKAVLGRDEAAAWLAVEDVMLSRKNFKALAETDS